METFEALINRRSIRKYTSEKIPHEKISEILKAAMYAPSAMNYQPWHFIVAEERADIDQIFKINPHAEMMQQAAAAIIVCGDLKLEQNIDYLVQDCSAATQNALLAVHALGMGAVWVSAYPNKDTIKGIREYYGIPENIVPVSIISIGFPDEEAATEDRFNKSRIHYKKW